MSGESTTTATLSTPYLIDMWSSDFWVPLYATLVSHALFFLMALGYKDNSVVDVAWGLSFIIANATAMIIRVVNGGFEQNVDARSIISNCLVLVWGLRMSIHIFSRLKPGQEDRRFAKLRAMLIEKGGSCLFYCVSFFGIFETNTLIIYAINAAALHTTMRSNGEPLTALDYAGIVVWLVGFLLLLVADMQLASFKVRRDAGETGGERLCKTGLWSWSRHPNYFGEALLWWGIYMIACGVQGGWVTFFAPLLLGLTLRFGSGVPLVEELYEDDDEFKQWCESTNTFVPWPPKQKTNGGSISESKQQ